MQDELLQELEKLTDSRKQWIIKFHLQNQWLILSSKWSSHNHQNWDWWYKDHIIEIFSIADTLYDWLNNKRTLNFSLDSVKIVLYFHDVEKILKYTFWVTWFDKWNYYINILPQKFGFNFEDFELNALKYIHWEWDDYSWHKRVMNELAAFCHCCDTISARIWYDYPMTNW